MPSTARNNYKVILQVHSLEPERFLPLRSGLDVIIVSESLHQSTLGLTYCNQIKTWEGRLSILTIDFLINGPISLIFGDKPVSLWTILPSKAHPPRLMTRDSNTRPKVLIPLIGSYTQLSYHLSQKQLMMENGTTIIL